MTYVTDELNDQQNEVATKGMETLVGVLGQRDPRPGGED